MALVHCSIGKNAGKVCLSSFSDGVDISTLPFWRERIKISDGGKVGAKTIDELGGEFRGREGDIVKLKLGNPFLEGSSVTEDGDIGAAEELKKFNAFSREFGRRPARTKERNCLVEELNSEALKVMGVGVHGGVSVAGEGKAEAFI